MTIEARGKGKFLVMLSREDLRHYDVNFAAMRLSEPHTKQMIYDLVGKLGRDPGGQVSVECAQTGDRGCVMLITLAGEKRYAFESADDVISAARAGLEPLLRDGLTREKGSWYFAPRRELTPYEKTLLTEFCTVNYAL
ncbi:MAG: hypothetical protein FWE86_00265 [Oscillospiraceae bacterium]|nr:hypothetical protein [Oscillospiraceae bacterium]